MKKNNIMLVIIFLIVISTGLFTLFKEQYDMSILENRTLVKIPAFTVKSYINKEYQSLLEDSLSDQYMFSNYIKNNINEFSYFLDFSQIPKNICSKKYVAIYGNESYKFYNFNCGDYIVMKQPQTINEKEIKGRIQTYNKINNYIDAYYYFISMPKIFNFEENEYNYGILELLKKELKNAKGFETFEYKNYDEYTKFFYKTDHHWNYKGSYIGYKDIISMIAPKEKIIKPQQEIVFNDFVFYGSRSRISQIYDFADTFVVYKFKYPKMEIINNVVSSKYGEEDNYFNNIYPKGKTVNHYAFYGNDAAEVIFNTEYNNKDNILIFGDSMSNPTNKLIASHFNRTHVIDLRHYETVFGTKFDIKKYIEENKIDKVLFIIDFDYLNDINFNIEWEV